MSTLTSGRLMDAPLADLLAELHVGLVEAEMPRAADFGCVGVLPDGSQVLVLPPSRPAEERDTVARMLLGKWAGVPLAPLPASVELTELDA